MFRNLLTDDIQSLLKNFKTVQWAISLKGASGTLQEETMSKRVSENLKEEMEYLGNVKVSEVEALQQKIVDVVRQLEDSGEISRPTGEEEEEYVN